MSTGSVSDQRFLWKTGITRWKKLNDAFVAALTLAACPKNFAFGGGAVLSFGIARMEWAAGELPRMQSWVGEIRSGGTLLTVTLMLYGEAALAVTCSHLPSEFG